MQVQQNTMGVLLNLDILTEQLAQFRRTGNRLHLAHAVRALDDAREDLRRLLQQPSPL